MNKIIQTIAKGLLKRLGRFEQRLLLEIDAAGDDAYCRELASRLGKTEGQVSRSLSTLIDLGVLDRRDVKPDPPQKHGRTRHVYRITEIGRKVFFE